ncbi:putative ABC transporter [Trypanosoma cruzi]|uniref:ABC transporter, putative n=2 Tax=Trypanosoma cruzi TaxID=5693 RepID=Q4DAY6_TRYCC|nr:ABC transporter, putative [Trypanosoma cruzi]EAN89676.1 ABC transporter, putative [Trypanosoma cruzi]PWV06629.1 putative ABC transporter [Trypanosoma cruzi]PWV06633.1 putative ABC transporter [Trypanosoma cruzi]PWV06637.1 putative ABC transporter [Trypanosoma cruzi]RNC34547.1 putative mitochondrial ATP-binding cassette protein subfamily G, member 4 [Trypanosoma cruzi]|eukprot:XP_811527.1 ABC transporter [Trypanosoma cruzi strain CL Brener]
MKTQSDGDAGASREEALSLGKVVNFSWENLTYRVPVEDDDGNVTYKTLLYNLSGTALGGRVLAIMGPSGAGKTTLMGTITGKLYNAKAKLDGCCFLNNTIYSQRYKKLVSYVSQDDIVMGKETPREAIKFACRVRLGLSMEESEKLVDEVISRLHITECQHTVLGIPGILKGVSGGERKRANVGTELVTNPCVMLLDEPTTGLDSVNALRVGKMLQELARRDMRTVIATVHSPSSDLFDVFDDLLLLAKGRVIYHGPTEDSVAYFASLGYQVPPRTNPSEYFMNILQLPEEELSQLWVAWEDYVMSPAANNNHCLMVVQGPITRQDEFLESQLKVKKSSFAVQFFELWKRSLRMFCRDPAAFFGRSFQTLFFSVFLGLFYFNLKLNQQGVQDRAGALYITLINNFFGACMHGISAYPPERAVFLQEQANDSYNAAVYFFAKYLAEIPFQMLFPTIFDLITYFMMHLYRSPGAFFVNWFILVLLATFGYSFGLMFATFFESSTTAFAIVPVIFLPLLVVAGLFANTQRLVPYWVWLNYLSFPRHAYLGVFVNEFQRLHVICDPVTPHCTYPNGEAVIEQFGFENWQPWRSMVALIAYQLGLAVIGCISLYVQGMRRRGKLAFKKNLGSRVASPRAIASARSNDELSDSDATPMDEIPTPSVAYTDTVPLDKDDPLHPGGGGARGMLTTPIVTPKADTRGQS